LIVGVDELVVVVFDGVDVAVKSVAGVGAVLLRRLRSLLPLQLLLRETL
jgi:hypothetical protein